MPPVAFTLALAAAFLHAFWNLLLARARDTESATAIALLVAAFVPGMSITIYALVIAWCAALYFFGPKLSKASGKSSMSSVFGSPFSQATSFVKKQVGTFFGSDKKK